MSIRNFMRRFQAATGDKPLHYLQRLRIETAKGMLSSTRKSIKTISYEVATTTPASSPACSASTPNSLPTITVASSCRRKAEPDIAGLPERHRRRRFPPEPRIGSQVSLRGFS